MEPKNILVRMPNWVGDLVMATPILADLRRAFPESSITALCKKPICDLLRFDPAIDELFCFTKPPSGFLRRQEKRNLIAKLTQGKYDVGILLTNSFSSAWWFWQGKVKRRIGFAGGICRRVLLSDALFFPKEKEHQVISYKRLLKPLGIPLSDTKPRLFLLDKEKERAKFLLEQKGWRINTKLIGMHPGASYGEAKCWLPERFQELSMRLLEDEGVSVVLLGDASMQEMMQKISCSLPERVINLTGSTNLRELAAVMSYCSLLITNDSGPMHMGAALGVPLVALFGSTDPEKTGPYAQPQAVVRKPAQCSPCFRRVCPIDFRCMKEIQVEEVLQRARSKLC